MLVFCNDGDLSFIRGMGGGGLVKMGVGLYILCNQKPKKGGHQNLSWALGRAIPFFSKHCCSLKEVVSRFECEFIPQLGIRR